MPRRRRRCTAVSRGRKNMDELITQAPTGTTMILRALARCPERTAFAWDGGSLTYRATLDLIGRLQAAMAAAGLAKGETVEFLSAISAETWCAGVAASGLGLITTWLHPLGALADHVEVIEDAAARRHGASPEGLRAGEIFNHHRAREDQLHPRGADHDLCAAGSSAARQDRPFLARARPLRRLADVADAPRGGAGAHRADLQPAL